jgi:hypothetical protein
MITVDADIEAVVAFRAEHSLDALIDVHTHFMPHQVLAKVWAYFDRMREKNGYSWPIEYRDEEDARAARLRAYGVRTFTAMIYPHKPDMAEWLNGWGAEFAARTPDCLRTATFYPEPSAVRYVTEAIETGTRVFKSHLQVGAYDPADPLLTGVWGALAEAAIPVVTHCGSGPEPAPYTGPGPIGRVLAEHPRLRLIVAHLGAPEYREFLDVAERYPDVHLDTTMSFTDFSEIGAPFPRTELARLRELGDRVLFGSDYPNIPYPYAHALQVLADLDLGEDWLRAVCHDNTARLFGI